MVGYYKKHSYYYKKPQKNKKINYNRRIILLHWLAVFVLVLIILRLFDLQVLHHKDYIAQAGSLHNTKTTLMPLRGLIYCQDKDGNLIPVAINKKIYTLFAVPKEIDDFSQTTKTLAQYLPLSQEKIYAKINNPDSSYAPILKNIEDEKLVETIKALKLKGVYFEEERSRYYPFGSFASQTIGFVSQGADNEVKGRYGLEAYYDAILSGQQGVFEGKKDAAGRLVRSLLSREKEVIDGVSLITTIDKNVQFATEQALADLIKTQSAKGGTIIVMEAKTGKILSLANWPTFDLNNFAQVEDYSIFRNPAVESRYEPGSVIKSFTMAAGLELGKITPDTTYVDTGVFQMGNSKIVNYNYAVYGKVDMRKVLERSINTGAIFVEQQIGGENLRTYFKKFGLDEKTGIDLPNEITGDLSNLEFPKAHPINFVTASYGLGLSVTPLELIRAYAAIANNGFTVTPYLVEAIKFDDGYQEIVALPESRQVISPKTAETLTSMLVNAITNGYGGKAKIKGYSLAGKTGTSAMAFTDKKGYSDEYYHSFVGFFPATNPRFVILVKLDGPNSINVASYTVTIAFREVEQFLINYYNIPPDEK
jgi:cell division protein FtsI/penicillin-binding protein 2